MYVLKKEFNIKENFTNGLLELRTKKRVSARKMSLDLGQNSSCIQKIESKRSFP